MQDINKTFRSMFRHRQGIEILGRKVDRVTIPLINKTIYLDNQVPGAILDTIDNLNLTAKQ